MVTSNQIPVPQESATVQDAAKENKLRGKKVAVGVEVNANVQDAPLEVASSSQPVGLVPARSGIWDPEAVNVPTLLDAAALAWQTRRAPAPSRHENRYTSGTTVQYLNQAFVDKIFSGVLKVDILSVTHPRGPLHPRLSARSGIRVTLKDKFRQAIAGYHSPDNEHKGTAFLWLHKGEEVATTTALTFEHVRAGSREELAENPEVRTLAEADLVIDTQISTSPPDQPYKVVLKAGEKDEAVVEVAVSYVPLRMETPAARLDAPEASMEGDKLRLSIDLGAQNFSIDENEEVAVFEVPEPQQGIRLGNLPSFRECMKEDLLYEAAFSLGLLFEGGFFQHERGAEPIAFIENKSTRTELIVFWNEELKQIAIAFDSTRQNEFQDLVTDAQILPVIFDETLEKDGERFRSWIRWFRGQSSEDTQLVHGGFLSAWRSVQFATDTLIRQTIGMKDSEQLSDCSWKTIFTGHSLGGALATLATASAVASGRENQQVSLYTFGCPRVGNVKFLEAIYAKVPERLRVFNQADSVSYVPRSTGFEATAPALCFMPKTQEDGTPLVNFSFPDKELPITVVPGRPVDDEAKQAIMLEYPGINNLWDRVTFESGLAWNLVSTRGIQAHSTELYLNNLVSLTTDVALGAPGLTPKEDDDLKKGLAEVKAMLDKYKTKQDCKDAEE